MALRIRRLLAVLVLFIHACRAQRICNNAAALCSKPYNQVVHLGAHDSAFIRNKQNNYDIAGDQFYGSVTQLDAGVRMLTAQVHKFTTASGATEWHLCHTYCELYDAGKLSTWLTGIRQWLDGNPNEVVSILLVNSDNANAQTLGAQFTAAGIVHYAYTPPVRTQPTSSWPTLNSMITNNKRLVVYVASLDPSKNTAAPYLLDEFTFAFENNYDNVKPSDFSCTANRPASLNGRTQAAIASGRMPIMNHFRYDDLGGGIEVPDQDDADSTNSPNYQAGNLGLAGRQCTSVYGKPPTFILVDFFNVGPALATVDRLNGVTGQTVGRKALPTTVNGTINSQKGAGQKSSQISSRSGDGSPTKHNNSGGSPSTGSSSTVAPAPTAASGSGKNAASQPLTIQAERLSLFVVFVVTLCLAI